MKLRKELPNSEFIMDKLTVKEFNLLLMILRGTGINIAGSCKGYDKNYPNMQWDGTEISQYRADETDDTISTKEFIENLFVVEKEPISVKITNDYTAEINNKGIEVGCQLITFDKFDELSKKVAEFRAE